jgi:DNA repair exonuclease SbcCD nuclease subunit
VKFVVVSDLHLDKETLGVPRLPEVERALWQAASHAIEIEADAFFFLGDLTDPDSGGAAVKASRIAMDVAMQLGRNRCNHQGAIPSFWMVGNHDVFEDGSGLTTLEVMRPLFDEFHVSLIDEPKLVEFGDVSLVFLPYTPVARGYDTAKAAKRMMSDARARGRVVVASHLNIPGISVGEETNEMPRGREVMLPLEETSGALFRLSGHYHTRQDFDPGDGGPPIHVVGSPAAYSFGEHDGVTPAFSVITV